MSELGHIQEEAGGNESEIPYRGMKALAGDWHVNDNILKPRNH